MRREDHVLKGVIVLKVQDDLKVVNLEHLLTKLVSHHVNHVVLGIIVMVIHLYVINHAPQGIIARKEQSTQDNSPVHVGISTTSRVALMSGSFHVIHIVLITCSFGRSLVLTLFVMANIIQEVKKLFHIL